MRKIVEHYFTTRSYSKIYELFLGEFTDIIPPNKSIIVRIVNKFCMEYSIWNKVPKHEKTALTPQKVEETRESVLATPSISTIRRMRSLNVYKTMIQSVLTVLLNAFVSHLFSIRIKDTRLLQTFAFL